MQLPILQTANTRPATEASHAWYGHDPKDWHIFEDGGNSFLFVADGSRVYQIDQPVAEALQQLPFAETDTRLVLAALGVPLLERVDDSAPEAMPPRSLSLAVVQKCNLGCTYCYAQEGDFGGEPERMSEQVARAAVDRLFDGLRPGERVNIAYMGGEPLINRALVRNVTEYASGRAEERGATVGFSITTNGTLLTADDGDFFERHGFAVTVSLDGIGEINDRLRPFKGGRGSFASIRENVRPLLGQQCKMQVSARVTVTPRNMLLRETLDELISWGFYSVGFSPMLSSPTGREEMAASELTTMLEQMIECGAEFERRLHAGKHYPFSNLMGALQEIHRGTHRPYPCGAGAGYFGVSADGGLWACHRFVNDAAGAMGNLADGVDEERQRKWLDSRHVHRQEPCRSCWARYLCGGACHHEVIHRGRPACDYIRGWLDYCLRAYVRLSNARPEMFQEN
jgi:radical SAM additional 4Fe4S-binding domain